jgi:hypothetical protein
LDTPVTNNALESTNNRIKQDETLRNRLPLPRFLYLIENSLLTKWSAQRDSAAINSKLFVNIPTMSTALLTKSYQWAAEPREILSKPRGADWRDYYVPAAQHPADYGPDLVRKYRSSFDFLRCDSLNDYVRLRSKLWVVSVYQDQWDTASCNCPVFLKEFVCKHSIGLAIKRKKFNVPAVAKNIPIGKKRKRGRPRLATAALLRD